MVCTKKTDVSILLVFVLKSTIGGIFHFTKDIPINQHLKIQNKKTASFFRDSFLTFFIKIYKERKGFAI